MPVHFWCIKCQKKMWKSIQLELCANLPAEGSVTQHCSRTLTSGSAARLCYGAVGLYLAVQLLVQLADALCKLGQLLSNDSMVNSLSRVGLYIKILCRKVRVALCKHSSASSNHSVHSHVCITKRCCYNAARSMLQLKRNSNFQAF